MIGLVGNPDMTARSEDDLRCLSSAAGEPARRVKDDLFSGSVHGDKVSSGMSACISQSSKRTAAVAVLLLLVDQRLQDRDLCFQAFQLRFIIRHRRKRDPCYFNDAEVRLK